MKGATPFLAIFLGLLLVTLPVCFSAAVSYDANGNVIWTESNNLYRVYNSENRLWKIYNGTNESGILLEEFTWHLTEERILMKKIYNSSGAVIEKDIYVTPNYVRIKNASGTYDQMIVTHEGATIAQVNTDNSTYFMLTDHKSTVVVTTNASGAVLENSTYSPYGDIISGGSKTRYSFTGKEYDSVIGDYDFHARRYDPNLGKFLQPDPLMPNRYNPQELNRYSYVKNNPWKYIDEDGNFAVLPILAGAAIGATINFGVQMWQSGGDISQVNWGDVGASAVAGGTSVLGWGVAAIGGAASAVISKYSHGDKIQDWDIGDGIDIVASGAMAGALAGLSDKLLPYAGAYKIKYPQRYFTTATGQQFIINSLSEEAASAAGNYCYDYASNSNSRNAVDNSNKAQSAGQGSGSARASSGSSSKPTITVGQATRDASKVKNSVNAYWTRPAPAPAPKPAPKKK